MCSGFAATFTSDEAVGRQLWLDFSIHVVIALFGAFVTITMWMVRKLHLHNVASGPMPLIPLDKAS